MRSDAKKQTNKQINKLTQLPGPKRGIEAGTDKGMNGVKEMPWLA